jgi:hypothetical protein
MGKIGGHGHDSKLRVDTHRGGEDAGIAPENDEAPLAD